MQVTATQAIIPKARGLYAKHLSAAEYEELMRRRTVPELAAILKRHPFYKESLTTLSVIDPHRSQIEELLSMDIFKKFEALLRYDFSDDGFGRYYLAECEMREILKALHLLSIGIPRGYLGQVPAYLVGKTHIDLFALGQAASFPQVLEVVRGTHYYKPLRARYLADPMLRDFPMTEAALLREYYAELFALIGRNLSGREAQNVRSLFLQEAEIYNLELIMRVKAFFPRAYTPEEIGRLVLPHTFHLTKRSLTEMIEAKSVETLMALYRQSSAVKYTGPATPDDLAAAGGRMLYHHARRVLHLTASPMAALAAFITLAKLERENVVNVVEGVRYGLTPETMRGMLRV